jgi:hypothetical protein
MSHFPQIFQNARTRENGESGVGNVSMRDKPERGAAGGLAISDWPYFNNN